MPGSLTRLIPRSFFLSQGSIQDLNLGNRNASNFLGISNVKTYCRQIGTLFSGSCLM